MLVDPMQYILLSKGTAKQDWSIHVEFLTDQNCFRMVFRCNGAPKVNKPLKIKNSSKTCLLYTSPPPAKKVWAE